MHVRRYLLTGLVTAIPTLVTLFVFSFFLSDISRPKVQLLANALRPASPELARLLLEVPWLTSAFAVFLTLTMFYLLGWAMSRLIGRRVPSQVEELVGRIPLVIGPWTRP